MSFIFIFSLLGVDEWRETTSSSFPLTMTIFLKYPPKNTRTIIKLLAERKLADTLKYWYDEM